MQNYGYDSALRLQSTSASGQPGSFSYTYSGASRLVSTLGLPNGASIANSYDGLGG